MLNQHLFFDLLRELPDTPRSYLTLIVVEFTRQHRVSGDPTSDL
jgi:hypothetical protein